jgi:hypothetical protein
MYENIKILKTAAIGIILPYGLQPIVDLSLQNFADMVNSGLQFIIGVIAIYRILKTKSNKPKTKI